MEMVADTNNTIYNNICTILHRMRHYTSNKNKHLLSSSSKQLLKNFSLSWVVVLWTAATITLN